MQKSKDNIHYNSNFQYLEDEFSKLDMLLKYKIYENRNISVSDTNKEFKGIFISDSEVDALLSEDRSTKNKVSANPDEFSLNILQTIELIDQSITARKELSFKEGVFLGLPGLSQIFGLNRIEEQIILILLAPEMDRKYEKLYAYLQDDITRKKVSLDLISTLLANSDEETVYLRTCFLPQSLLIKHNLINFYDDQRNGSNTLLSRSLKLDSSITNFLLGLDTVDERLANSTELFYPDKSNIQTVLKQKEGKQLLVIARSYLKNKTTPYQKLIFHFSGPKSSGKKTVAKAICTELTIPLIMVDAEQLISEGKMLTNDFQLIFRESILRQAAVLIDNFHCLLNENYIIQLNGLLRIIDENSWLTFLCGNNTWQPTEIINRHKYIPVEFSIPEYKKRIEYWKALSNGSMQFSSDVNINTLSSRFRFTPGQIRSSLNAAQNLAYRENPEKPVIKQELLYEACRTHSNQKLSTLAKKITPNYTWDDIILRNDIEHKLRAVCNHEKYKHCVFEEWGFNEKVSFGKGLNAMFYGPSGTGKTMAAEIIANDLQLDLYKIDLSQVVSKYIGETEKNLNKIFTEAETSNAILFFDEADALFGKRSEVKDSHDRYSNIEIAYLLQKMEEYEGISILATNMKQNMDEAFIRRLRFVIEFPFPDTNEREQIWNKIFPDDVPFEYKVDYQVLANQLKITGGSIRNIAINAAFLAASNSGAINNEHLFIATKEEYKKMGRSLTLSGFAEELKVSNT